MLRGIVADFSYLFIRQSLAESEMKYLSISRVNHVLVNGIAHVGSFVRHCCEPPNKSKMPPLSHKGMSGGSVFGGSFVKFFGKFEKLPN